MLKTVLLRQRPGEKDCETLLDELWVTETALERMRGLLGRPPLTAQWGLWIRSCNAVHTCFMQYPLDLVFLDRQQRVCHRVIALSPWRCSGSWRATSVVELQAGQVERQQIQVGDRLLWKD